MKKFAYSDVLNINGNVFENLRYGLPESVKVTGGLSGDGERFNKTSVLLDGLPKDNAITVLGFYGENITLGIASMEDYIHFSKCVVGYNQKHIHRENDRGSFT